MAQWLVEGLTATISGVVTVFVVLILIAFVISRLRHVDKLGYKKMRAKASRNQVAAKTTQQVPVEDDLELIAVITASIASSLNTTADKLVVRSIRRVEHSHRRRL